MEAGHQMEPESCSGMEDIRREIDLLDRAVISLLGRRFRFVLAASGFKASSAAVQAPGRFKAMIGKRREWATEEGLSPDAIEKMYTDLVNHFIDEEMKHWAADQQRRAR